MKEIRGRNALLTGASRGLGPYIARALGSEGVNIALAARSAVQLEQTETTLAEYGVRAAAITADITSAQARQELVAQAERDLGKIDLLINNAGVEWIARYASLSEGFIESMIETNLTAPLLLSRLLLPGMLGRGRGHVVMMSSLGGKKGSPYSATYAATKAALIEWSAGMREELRGTGVGVSVVCPGFVSDAGMFAAYGKRAPRIAGESKPEAVAEAVVRAIKKESGEIVVSPGPIRLLTVANAISPGFVTWLLRTFGVYSFYRTQAEANEAAAQTGSGLEMTVRRGGNPPNHR